MTQFVPSADGKSGGAPVWDGESPFDGSTKEGKAATAALVALRKGLSRFLDGWPADGMLRVLRTNWEQPTHIPRVIDL